MKRSQGFVIRRCQIRRCGTHRDAAHLLGFHHWGRRRRQYSRVYRHAGFGSSLQRTLQKNRIVHRCVRHWMELRDLVQIRLMLGIGCKLFRNAGTFHVLAQMRHGPQEEWMVIAIAVAAGRNSAKSPAVGLPDKRGELGVFKICRNHTNFEFPRFHHFPTTAVIHPANYVC